MRTLKWNAIVLAGALVCVAPIAAQQQTAGLKSMTVAELEAAGDACRELKDYDCAIKYFQQAVNKDKKSAMLRNKLGLSLLKAGNTDEARYYFEKATKLNPKSPDVVNNLGAIYFMENKLGLAAKYFKKAVALEETRATFHVNLGAAWFGQKKFDRAMREYARAVELDPTVLESHAKIGVTAQIAHPEDVAKYYYMLAKVYAKNGNVDRCLLCLSRAKDYGYHDLGNVYKEEEFSRLWADARLAQLIPPPTSK